MALNKTMLTGRLIKDPIVKYSQGENQICISRFTLAVDRRRNRNQDEAQTADFISCVAFNKTGEFVEKYARKGMKFDVVGRIQTGNYQSKDGNTVYTTEVVVEEIEFGESKKTSQDNAPAEKPVEQEEEGFMTVTQDDIDELPFV